MAEYQVSAVFHFEVTVSYTIDKDEWEGDNDATSRGVMAEEKANELLHDSNIFVPENAVLSYETNYEIDDIALVEAQEAEDGNGTI
jgi:hypothetical protein